MKIAVEDSIKLYDEHLKRLKELGEVVFCKFKNTTREQFINEVKDCGVIFINKTFYNDAFPELKVKFISLWSTGYDVMDLEQCKKNNVVVSNVPGYAKNSVAEHAIGLMFELAKKFCMQGKALRQGKWAQDLPTLIEFKGKTMGVIGLGNIGSKVAEIASSLEMNILVYTKTNKQDKFSKYNFVSLNDLLQKSDFISLNCLLSDKTKHIISKEQLKLMKKTAFLINTSRGSLINQKDLVWALKNNEISGAGLDVFETEPMPEDEEIKKLDNAVLTPHTAFYTKDSVTRLGDIAIDNIENFLNGKATNKIV
jgi:glycerate dehydrogenase